MIKSSYRENKELVWVDGHIPPINVVMEMYKGGYERLLKYYKKHHNIEVPSHDDNFSTMLMSVAMRPPFAENPDHIFYLTPTAKNLSTSNKWRKVFNVIKKEFEKDKDHERYRFLLFIYDGAGKVCNDESHLDPELISLVERGVIHDANDIKVVSPTKRTHDGISGSRIYRIGFEASELPTHIHLDDEFGKEKTKEILSKVKFEIKPDDAYSEDNFSKVVDRALTTIDDVYLFPRFVVQKHLKQHGLEGRVCYWSGFTRNKFS